jgi:hypothetical protein
MNNELNNLMDFAKEFLIEFEKPALKIDMDDEVLKEFAKGFYSYYDLVKPKPEIDKAEKIMSYFQKSENDTYYNQIAISQSFISHVLNVENETLQNDFITAEQLQKVFNIGKSFEDRLFGIENHYELDPESIQLVSCMVQSCKNIFTPAENFIRDYKVLGALQYKGDFILCKGKIDYFADGVIKDIKSTSAQGIVAFLTSCKKFNYFVQPYIYCTLCNVDNFEFVCTSKKGKINSFIYKVTKEDLEVGRNLVMQAFEILEKYDLLKNFII